jgi:hypothetical protein
LRGLTLRHVVVDPPPVMDYFSSNSGRSHKMALKPKTVEQAPAGKKAKEGKCEQPLKTGICCNIGKKSA